MFCGKKIKNREVISCESAKRIGCVWDIEFDEETGKVTAIIAVRGGYLRRFFGVGEMVIPWSAVRAISNEFVLVDMYTEPKK